MVKMKKWWIIIVLVYAEIIISLSVPVLNLISHDDSLLFSGLYWIWIIFLLIGEAVLLFIPVTSENRIKKGKRPVFWPLLATIIFFAVLVFAAIMNVLVAAMAEKGLDIILFFTSGEYDKYQIAFIVWIIPVWIVWAIIFYKFNKNTDSQKRYVKFIKHLFAGSVLELLIAVPSHMIVNKRGDCCAGYGTTFGISMGICIMLMSFGPGVLLLYKSRIKMKKERKVKIPNQQ